MAYSSLDFRIMSHGFTDPSGEINMEIVAPGAGQSAFTQIATGVTSGEWPAEPSDIKSKGRVVIGLRFSASGEAQEALIRPIGYDASDAALGPILEGFADQYIKVCPTSYEIGGKYVAPLIPVANEDVGASGLAVELIAVQSGTVDMYFGIMD